MSKKFRQCLAAFLSVLLFLSMVPVSVFVSAEGSENLTFLLTDNAGKPLSEAIIALYVKQDKIAEGSTNTEGSYSFKNLSDREELTKAAITYGGATKYIFTDFTASEFALNFDTMPVYAKQTIDCDPIEVMYGEKTEVNASAQGSLTYTVVDGEEFISVENGEITATAVGVATVGIYAAATAELSDAYKEVVVTVVPSDKALIGFEHDTIPNAEKRTYSNPVEIAEDAKGKGTVKYESSAPDYASVDDEGNVTVNFSGGSAEITATFYPNESDAPEYAECSKSYVISSEYLVSYEKNEEYEFTKEGIITISGLFDGDKVTFRIGENEYAVNGNTIDIAKTADIPQGRSDLAIFVNGKEVKTISIAKDTEKPSFHSDHDSVILNNAWMKDCPTVTISEITDATSGIHSVMVYRNGDVIKTSNSADPFTLTDDDFINGKNEIKIVVTDNAGNTAELPFSVWKDTVAPAFNDEAFPALQDKWFNEDAFGTELDLGITAENGEESPIAKVEYYEILPDETTDKTVEVSANAENNYVVSLRELLEDADEGKHTFEFVATDEAGNPAKKQLTVGADLTKPDLSTTYDKNDQWLNTVEDAFVAVETADASSGIKETKYYIVQGDASESDAVNEAKDVVDGKINISDLELADGIYKLYVYTVDNAGNQTKIPDPHIIKIDTTDPSVINFDFKEIDDSSASQILNALTFGKFFRHGLQVTVQVQDETSGLGGEATISAVSKDDPTKQLTYTDSSPDANGKYIFVIPETDFATANANADSQNVFQGNISIAFSDNAGNNANVAATDQNSDSIGEIMWEQNKPECAISVDSKNTFDHWYDAPDFTVTFRDADSGIKSYCITVNENIISNFTASEIGELITEEYAVTVSAKDLVDLRYEDGKFIVSVDVEDAAGNTRTVSREFFVDTDKPIISSIKFNGEDATLLEAASEEYKYFFAEDTVVAVTADDNGLDKENLIPSSGIGNIILQTISAEGEMAEIMPTSIDTVAGTAKFIVKAGFKGDIRASAIDNVRNSSDFVSPDKIIVETQEVHDQLEHILIDMVPAYQPNASYSQKVSPVITVLDKFAGVRDLEVTVTGDTIADGVYDEKITVSDEDLHNWAITANESNLVIALSKTLTIAENCNNIVINIKMHDNCGNVSEAAYCFNIDTVAPRINKLDFNVDSGGSLYDNTWYNKPVTLSAIIEERDIQDIIWNVQKKDANGEYVNYEINEYSLSVISKPDSGNGDEKQSELKYRFIEDGEYKVAFTVVDKAGNRVVSEESYFGIDTKAPAVKSVTIDGLTVSEASEYISEKNGVLVFDKGATVTVVLNDNAGSGLPEQLNYTLIYAADDGRRSEEVAMGTDGTAVITLPDNFRGNLVLEPVDIIGNETEIDVLCWTTQSEEEHALDGITITAQTDTTSVLSGDYVDQDVQIAVAAKDSAGIAKIEWTITDGDNNTQTSGVVNTLNNNNTYGWTFNDAVGIQVGNSDQYTAQVYTSATNSFALTNNANNITVTVKITDFAGNVSEESFTCHIDKVSPVVSIIPPAANYIKQNIDYFEDETELKITAIERNFTDFIVEVEKDGSAYTGYTKTDNVVDNPSVGISDEMSTSSTLKFTEEGRYHVSVTVKDRAGKEMTCAYQFVIDCTAPTITHVSFTYEDGSPLEQLVKIFTFGIFNNDRVWIDIAADDYCNGVTDDAVGIAKYRVFIGDTMYESEESVIEIPYTVDGDTLQNVSVEVLDQLGNTTGKFVPSKENKIETNAITNADGSVKLLIEKDPPVVELSIQDSDVIRFVQNGDIWYSNDVDMIINAADSGAGIRNITATLNGQEVCNEDYYGGDTAVKEQQIVINTSAVEYGRI